MAFERVFPTYPKDFLKASTSAKEKKQKEIRTIMADRMNCEIITVTAIFHYICLWVMITKGLK